MANEHLLVDISESARIKAAAILRRKRVELPPHLRSTPEEDAAIDAITRQRLADARAGVVRKGVSEHGFSVIGPPVTTDEPGTVMPTAAPAPEATR